MKKENGVEETEVLNRRRTPCTVSKAWDVVEEQEDPRSAHVTGDVNKPKQP